VEWDKYKKPPEDICPEEFCFLWSESKNKCREPFGKCRRVTKKLIHTDWYEPCEPELKKYDLPWFYFIPNIENLVEESKDKYLRESKKLWGK
jgi:hypothetical protein